MYHYAGSSAAIAVLFCAAVLLVTQHMATGAEAAPASPYSARRNDAWKVIGPGGGGAQFAPAISPHDPKKMLVASDMTDSFISEDGGESWRMFNLRGVTRFFVFDPGDANVIYARSVGLFRSVDGGATWRLVHPAPDSVKGIIHVGDHAGDVLVTGEDSQETVTALAVDPADSRTLYAAMSKADETRLCISTDWGRTWKAAGELPGGGRRIYVDPKSPAGERTLYVIGRNSISVREGGEWTQQEGPEGVASFNDVSAAFPAGGGRPVVYAVSGRAWRGGEGIAGVFVSTDGGSNWVKTDGDLFAKGAAGMSEPRLQAVATSDANPAAAYLSYSRLATGASAREQFLGVAKTSDFGKTWQLVWKESDTPGANIKDAWINERYGPWWGENPFNLAVAPTNSDICIGTDFGRTMRTTDGGKTWEACYSKKMGDGSWATTGLDVTCCYAVHFDPFDANHMFISYTDVGLFDSENGGTGWRSATANGVPDKWLNATYWVEFDPEVKGRMWAVMSGTHDLPRTKMWRNRGAVAKYGGGVCASEDGGKTWAASDEGINQTAATHVILDPESPAGKRTLWVCGFGKGVFKSTDDGKTWALKNDRIEEAEPFAWRITRAKDGTLYLIVVRRTDEGGAGDERPGAVYRSKDGAEHWERMALPEGVTGPTDIQIDSKDPKRLCLGAWGTPNEKGDTGGGIYISADAGETWKCVLEKDQHIHDVTVDARNNVYYACGHESNAWRSDDAGETWRRIKGFNFKWGRRVVPDARDAGMVYITTFGGAVWYGPAQGDPKAPEDIATPEVGYGR